MEAIIQTTLNKAQADALFEEECIFIGEDAVPEYRLVELFGAYIAELVERCTHTEGFLQGGKDYNEWGLGSLDTNLRHFYRAGFYKIVSHNNVRLSLERHLQSPAGNVIDSVWKARKERQAAEDAEEIRRMEGLL